MRHITFIFLLSFSLCASPSFAQENPIEDEVIASGTIRTDKAMSAFLTGDYATAEIEFMKNARCALRATRGLEAGIESARNSVLRSDITASGNAAPQPAGGQGGVTVASTPTASPSVRVNASSFQKNESIAARTCDDRGFQLYMEGLSQIKLGKMEEAKQSLKSAVAIRKTIHDAHFRLALLEYQDGNLKKANKQFKKLRKLGDKCKRCEFKEAIESQVQYLETLLG